MGPDVHSQQPALPDCFLTEPPGPAPSEAGCDCVKAALTCEEESILMQMVEIKGEVCQLRQRVDQLERELEPALFSKLSETRDPMERLHLLGEVERHEEWKRLYTRLSHLRQEFRSHQAQLRKANHRKMVMLGHASA